MTDPRAHGGVRLRAVVKSYREGTTQRVVLSGIDAQADPGEIIALVGRSGAGKSTLLHLLAGIDLPDAGQVMVEGIDLGSLSEADRTRFRRRRMGFVFQAFNLLPTLTVLENVCLRFALDGRRDAASASAGHAALAQVGLAARAASFPDRLSGGEQQRVAIAAALVHRPAVVLADEPTGNLDRANAATVLALMTDLARTAGATLIIATHAPDVAQAADRTWQLADGRLA